MPPGAHTPNLLQLRTYEYSERALCRNCIIVSLEVYNIAHFHLSPENEKIHKCNKLKFINDYHSNITELQNVPRM